MKKIILPCIAGFILLFIFHKDACAQEVLTLEEVIRMGLHNNYDIKIARNDQEVLENNYNYGKYNFLPNVSAIGGWNWNVENTEQQRFNDSLPIIVNGARSNQLTGSVNLEWTIFDGLGMFIAYDRLNELRNAGDLTLKATIEGNVAAISQAYYQIVLEKEKVGVLENTVELSEKRLEMAKAIFEVGRSSKLEYLAAQVDLNADNSALINQKELLYNAKMNLNRIIGGGLEDNFDVVNTINTDENLDYLDLKQVMLANNPNLQVVESNQRASLLATRQVRSERSPEISVNGGYRYNEQESQVGFASYFISSGYYYGLSATLNVFNGFDIRRRAQNAKINEESLDILYDQLQTDLLTELNNTFVAYRNALHLVQLETDNFQLAQESEDIAYERYQLGNANFLELREAQRNAVEAESRLLNAVYNTKIAEIDLKRLSGQLVN